MLQQWEQQDRERENIYYNDSALDRWLLAVLPSFTKIFYLIQKLCEGDRHNTLSLSSHMRVHARAHTRTHSLFPIIDLTFHSMPSLKFY
jgi:hypothetical protein